MIFIFIWISSTANSEEKNYISSSILHENRPKEERMHQEQMMMRWRKHKASSDTTPKPRPSFITKFFPVSWLPKSKQSEDSSTHASAKAEEKKGQLKLPSLIPSQEIYLSEGRFYGGDDNSYWRLSFGDDQAMIPTIGEKSVQYALNEDLNISRRAVSSKSQGLVYNLGQARIRQPKMSFPVKTYAVRRNKVREGAEPRIARRQTVKVRNFGRKGLRTVPQKHAEEEFFQEEDMSTKAADKFIIEVQPERTFHCGQDFFQTRASNSQERHVFPFPDSKLRKIEEDCTLEIVNLEGTHKQGDEKLCLKCKISEEMKVIATNSNNEQQRKSVYIKGGFWRKKKLAGRIKSSPRTAARFELKIKPLEDMKKVEMIKKKKNKIGKADTGKKSAPITKEKAQGDIRTFDSYAMIKNSHNPQQDFRESMIEMIIEEGIERPQELEELLACYLNLNYDEYHDLIVKVFREVWLELNGANLMTHLHSLYS